MRIKILPLLVLLLLSGALSAQPLNWRESSPVEFVPMTVKGEYDMVSEGSRAVKIIFTETGTPYYVSDTFNVTAGAAFDFAIDILDNDPGTEVNQRIRFVNGTGTGTNLTSSVYTADNVGFQTYSYTGTAPADAVKAYVILRIYDVTANWTGSGSFIIDNASFKENGGSNLLANPGFENWPAPQILEGSTLVSWMESSPLEFVPVAVVPEFTQVSHGQVAAKITFTETGTPYYVSDTFNVTANTDFSFNIDILDNDAGVEVNQRVRFIDGAGTGTNMTSAVYSADNAAYQTYTYTGTAPAGAEKAYVILRLYDASANWTGSGTFYVDHASFTQTGGSANLIPNASFEEWMAPAGFPEILSYKFEGLTPAVTGFVDKVAHTVSLTVPYATDLTALVSTFTLTEGATAKVGATDQVSGQTANNFSTALTYSLTSEDGLTTKDWSIIVSKAPAATGKDILTFRFEGVNPPANGSVNNTDHTVAIEVPSGTAVNALVPTIITSDFAGISPLSGLAQDFTSPVTYTVTAQDGGSQAYVVTVTVASAGKTILFSEDFETITDIPSTWIIINNDGYTQAVGEERWQDSAWVISTSNRVELVGTHVAMASSFCANMPLDGRADDWMILPAITIGDNTTLSWQAMSTTTSGNYPDDYMVLIAPAPEGAVPTVSYFESEANILITVAPESWSAGVGNPGNGLISHSINLKNAITPSAANGWFNQKVWIAFVLTTDRYTNPITGIPNITAGGSNLAIDNILLVNESAVGVENTTGKNTGFSVYPNPTAGMVSLRMNVENGAVFDLDVVDLLGKVVVRKSISDKQTELDLTGLRKGIYFVRTSVNGVASVTKLVIK